MLPTWNGGGGRLSRRRGSCLRATLEAQRTVAEILQRRRGLDLPVGVPPQWQPDRRAPEGVGQGGLVPRWDAMKLVGDKTESIYRRYAIVDEAMLREGAEKLARADVLRAPARQTSMLP